MDHCSGYLYLQLNRYINQAYHHWASLKLKSCACERLRLFCAHHEGIMGNRHVVACILDLKTRWRWAVSIMPQLLYRQESVPWYTRKFRLGGPQIESGCSEKAKNLFPLLVMKSPFLSCSAHSLVPTPTEQPQLLYLCNCKGDSVAPGLSIILQVCVECTGEHSTHFKL